MSKPRTTLIIAFLLLTGMTSGCASWAQVTESETGQPIEGVYAITQWYADLNEIVRSEVVCLRVDVAKTDAAGRFEVSSSSGIVSPTLFNQRRFVILYKTRYKQLGPSESNELPLTMERDAREGIPRMKYLTQYILGVSCRDDEHDKRTLLPLYRAAYSEMETLAPEPTKEELALLYEAKFRIESLEIPYLQALRNWSQRRKAAGIK